MIEFYPQIKAAHVVLVFASGALFFVRALAVQFAQRWPLAAPARYLSYSIDTALLTSAFMLMTVLHQFPFVNSWLTVKITLVVIYIVLGTLALKRAPTPRARLLCGIGAVLVYALIISVARTHSPWGPLVRFASS
jgi:uncharacterized membrane protein SirB2